MDQVPALIPVLPIRNAVLFPSVSMPLVVGRGKSIKAVEKAESTTGLLVVIAQQVMTAGDPAPEDLYPVGTLCKLENVTQTELGSRQIVVTGITRYRITDYKQDAGGYLAARGEIVADLHHPDSVRNDAMFYNLKELSREILELLPGATEPLVRLIDRVDDPSYLTNVCAAYLNLSMPQKQQLLETVEVERRMDILLDHMRKERDVLNLQREIRDKMSERLNKAQREALLREQMRTIRSELGDEPGEDTDDLDVKVREANLPEEAAKQAAEELKRLRALPPNSAEYHVIRTYIETLAALPWNTKSPVNIDVARAREILDEDHYGLELVKRRILQFLAVAKLKNDLHGPILCLVGPPGVGKTSLGHSVARALGLKFIRTSLGGVRDEAEIRGHRRTYVGAMPGRILQSMKRAGTRNPLMMLDEIDKLRSDFHGDPSAAMLEVLDPEQNKTFIDHYVDVPFDLSDVFFVATANVVDTIPAPLLDRMEIIEVNGYTSLEKLAIAKRYIIPQQIKEHGLRAEWLDIPDETINRIITHHTREAGVRELKRKIAALLRSAAEQVVRRQSEAVARDARAANAAEPAAATVAPLSQDLSKPAAPGPAPFAAIRLGPEHLREMVGPEKFWPEFAERAVRAGVALGLAWTPHGGDVLYIEATSIPVGSGHLTLTGQLGDVMKESAQIAVSLAKSSALASLFGAFDFKESDIHVHVPSGAISKDGPSAGVTMLAAIVSLLSNRPIRPSLAMTGEITLRGAVLPVGGIKEKVLAAHRAEISTLVLPKRNEQDLYEVPDDVRRQLKFVFVETVDELLQAVLDLSEAPLFRISRIGTRGGPMPSMPAA